MTEILSIELTARRGGLRRNRTFTIEADGRTIYWPPTRFRSTNDRRSYRLAFLLGPVRARATRREREREREREGGEPRAFSRLPVACDHLILHGTTIEALARA